MDMSATCTHPAHAGRGPQRCRKTNSGAVTLAIVAALLLLLGQAVGPVHSTSVISADDNMGDAHHAGMHTRTHANEMRTLCGPQCRYSPC